MGELHLEIIIDRMKREFKVEANIGAPQVAYRETLIKPFEVDYTHKKQTGGAGQFARVKILFEPLDNGSGFKFINKVVGGNIPKEYISSIEKSIINVSKNGIISGYPFIDFKATLIDGSYHDVDSSSLAFEIASKAAFYEGAKCASIILLEPIMDVEVTTPKEYLGSIISHLNSIRGKIIDMVSKYKDQVIVSKVPLSTMFGFVNKLRSLSKGRANYIMKFRTYSKVPNYISQKIINN
jgi:elongation factor G